MMRSWVPSGRAMTAATGLAMFGVSCATPAPSTVGPEGRQYYFCTVQRQDALGRLTVEHELALDGTPLSVSATWQWWTSGWFVQLDARGNRLPTLADDMSVLLTIPATWRGGPRLRVELRPNDEAGFSGAPAVASPYEPRDTWTITEWRLSDMRAAVGDSAELVAVVVDRRGNVYARHRIERGLFDRPAAAIAAARPEIEAVVADYRNRCTLSSSDPIIVT